MSTTETILPQLYLAHLQRLRDQPFLWEKVSRNVRPLFWKELGTRVNLMMRGLDMLGINRQDRVAVLTDKGLNSFFAHLSTLMLGAVSVCFSRDCPLDDRIAAMRESGVKIIFADTLEQAESLLQHHGRMPQVTHIVIMEAIGTARSGEGPELLTFLDLMEKGRSHPDRTAAALRLIKPTDRAVMLHAMSDIGARATLLTHGELLAKCAQAEQALHPLRIQPQDVFLIASPFHESALHFAAAMLPLRHGLQACYNGDHDLEEMNLTSVNPTVIVGESIFFQALQRNALASAEKSGKVDSFIMRQALKIGKARYERPKKLSITEQISNKFLQGMIISKFHERMGGRLRAAICTDSNLTYDTQLFFYSFGVEVHEIDSSV